MASFSCHYFFVLIFPFLIPLYDFPNYFSDLPHKTTNFLLLFINKLITLACLYG